MPRLRSRSRDGRVARMQPPGWRGGSPGPLGRQDDCRGSASRERNHGVGDHPIPFRTRQLSPTSPKVLRRQAAGGQVVPLAGGAFSVLTSFEIASTEEACFRDAHAGVFLFLCALNREMGTASFFENIRTRIMFSGKLASMTEPKGSSGKGGFP